VTSILVVDGGPATRPGLLASTLGAGHEIREASTADEAFRLARAERPDLQLAQIPASFTTG
jgi:CheY-like chemotaxis protein